MAFITGIGGGTASGKTTFCEQLAQAFAGHNIKVMHMDNYFKPDELMPRATAPITGREYPDHNHPDTLDLPRFKQELLAAAQGFDIVLVEGNLALVDAEILKQLDLKIFIDCQADERVVRRLKRYKTGGNVANVADEDIFGWLSDIYLDLVRYRHDEYVAPSKWRADVILNGSMPSDKALAMVKRHILSEIEA